MDDSQPQGEASRSWLKRGHQLFTQPCTFMRAVSEYEQLTREDVPEIATSLLTALVDANEVPLKVLTVGAQNALRNLDWHGNLPVLQNAVKTLALTSLGPEIGGEEVARVAREFNLVPREQPATEVGVSLELPLRDAREQFERQYFMHHIRREDGNMSRVADRVGLERTHLYRKLKQLGIRPSSRGEDTSGA